jgi:hypothetical protein
VAVKGEEEEGELVLVHVVAEGKSFKENAVAFKVNSSSNALKSNLYTEAYFPESGKRHFLEFA